MWAAGGSRKLRGGEFWNRIAGVNLANSQAADVVRFDGHGTLVGYQGLPGGKQVPAGTIIGGRRRKGIKGGYADPYSSAAGYGMYVNGTEPQQWDRVFTNDGSTTPYGNVSIGAQGQNSVLPASVNFSGKILQGGKRRGKKRGGKYDGSNTFNFAPDNYAGRNPVQSDSGNLFGYQLPSVFGGKRSRSKRGGWGPGNPGRLVPAAVSEGQLFTQTGAGKKSRSKKGGQWLSQALVPFGLWGAQYQYGKRKTRKH